MEVSTKALLSAGMLVTLIGILDAVRVSSWDLVVLFVVAGSLFATLWLRSGIGRAPVDLRADLARWLDHRAERTGEPLSDVLDRAVASYQSDLFGPGDLEPGGNAVVESRRDRPSNGNGVNGGDASSAR